MKFHPTLERFYDFTSNFLSAHFLMLFSKITAALFVSIFSNFVVPPGRIRRVRREESFSDDADAGHRQDHRLQRSDLPVPSRTGKSGRGQIGHSKGYPRSAAAGPALDDSPFLLHFQLFHHNFYFRGFFLKIIIFIFL